MLTIVFFVVFAAAGTKNGRPTETWISAAAGDKMADRQKCELTLLAGCFCDDTKNPSFRMPTFVKLDMMSDTKRGSDEFGDACHQEVEIMIVTF